MDKTVRLWDLESKSCIKVFAHSDYGKITIPFHLVHVVVSNYNLRALGFGAGLQ